MGPAQGYRGRGGLPAGGCRLFGDAAGGDVSAATVVRTIAETHGAGINGDRWVHGKVPGLSIPPGETFQQAVGMSSPHNLHLRAHHDVKLGAIPMQPPRVMLVTYRARTAEATSLA